MLFIFGAITAERVTNLLLVPHLVLLLPVIFVGIPLIFLRSNDGHTLRVMAANYRDLKIYADQEPGLIPFSFQLFSGFFVYHFEVTLQGFATPGDAMKLGKRVLLHNWTSGLCAAAGLLGAIASTSQYFQMRRAANAVGIQQVPQKFRQAPLVIPNREVPSVRWQIFGTVLKYTGLVLLGLLVLCALLQLMLLQTNEINVWVLVLSLFVSLATMAISGLWN